MENNLKIYKKPETVQPDLPLMKSYRPETAI